MVQQFKVRYLLGSLLDRLADLGIEAVFHVDGCGGAFENAKGADYGRGHTVLWLIDAEVFERPLRLCAPVLVCRDMDFAKGVCFYAGRHDCSGRREMSCC